MRALIVEDGYARGALAAVRSLAAAGWHVGIGSPVRRGLAAASRHCGAWHLVPPPHEGVDEFLDAAASAVRAESYEIVLPAGDAEMLALSLGRDALRATFPYAPHERVLRAADKLLVTRAAETAGLATPKTVEAGDAEVERWSGPLVVKARLHWVPGTGGGPRIEPRVVSGPGEAAQAVASVRAAGGSPLLQEIVEGDLLAFSGLVDEEGRVIARIQQRADRVWPTPAGASVRGRTVPVDEGLAQGAERLLGSLGWVGLGQLQFLVPSGGRPVLVDFNGRLYGSLQLAVDAGVDFPLLWASSALGFPIAPGIARAGVRYHWLEGDLRRARVERRGGVVRDVLGCLRYAPGATHSIWRRDDPRPALRWSATLLRRLVS